jgi:malate dehydrogenase (oxaloacetate-decarboxylating)
VAQLSDATQPGTALLPPVEELKVVSAAVGIAVAEAARDEGLAESSLEDPIRQVHRAMWRPQYPLIQPI